MILSPRFDRVFHDPILAEGEVWQREKRYGERPNSLSASRDHGRRRHSGLLGDTLASKNNGEDSVRYDIIKVWKNVNRKNEEKNTK